jgi:hypothetical protein
MSNELNALNETAREIENKVLETKWCVVYLARAPAFYGPFNSIEDAEEWAKVILLSGTYYVTPLIAPMLTY